VAALGTRRAAQHRRLRHRAGVWRHAVPGRHRLL